MNHRSATLFTLMLALLLLTSPLLENTAQARAGSSRSMGSRGSRSYSRPAQSYTQQSPLRQPYAPAPGQYQQQSGGGFMRSMAGGLMGGMLGSMLFSGMAGAGGGLGGAGGGIGLFEILLLGALGYLLYRFIAKKREQPGDRYR